MFYAAWYRKDVSPHLTDEQKQQLARKLSDLSLRTPLCVDGVEIPLNDFPELKTFAHTSAFTGLQLYSVLSEVFNEISATKLEPPYPQLP